MNHTLFFTLLGGVNEEQEGGILFKNDFVIFDEAHTMESVASRHIGLSVSSGAGALRVEPAVESAHGKRFVGDVAPRGRSETGFRHLE
ncbi:MAG: hypothetical protein WDM76_07435 [Limisphaerales bacterium]